MPNDIIHAVSARPISIQTDRGWNVACGSTLLHKHHRILQPLPRPPLTTRHPCDLTAEPEQSVLLLRSVKLQPVDPTPYLELLRPSTPPTRHAQSE